MKLWKSYRNYFCSDCLLLLLLFILLLSLYITNQFHHWFLRANFVFQFVRNFCTQCNVQPTKLRKLKNCTNSFIGKSEDESNMRKGYYIVTCSSRSLSSLFCSLSSSPFSSSYRRACFSPLSLLFFYLVYFFFIATWNNTQDAVLVSPDVVGGFAFQHPAIANSFATTKLSETEYSTTQNNIRFQCSNTDPIGEFGEISVRSVPKESDHSLWCSQRDPIRKEPNEKEWKPKNEVSKNRNREKQKEEAKKNDEKRKAEGGETTREADAAKKQKREEEQKRSTREEREQKRSR